MTDIIIAMLDSTYETIQKSRNILSTTHDKNIHIILHSVNHDNEAMYSFIEELIEYRIIYTSKKIIVYVPMVALNLGCLLCLVADEYYASPDAVFSPFALIIKTPSLSLTEADVDNYLKMTTNSSLASKLKTYRDFFKHYHSRISLIIQLHPKYGVHSHKILQRLLYEPSQQRSEVDELLYGIKDYLSVKDMFAIGAGPVDDIPYHISSIITSLLPKD